MEEVSGQDLGWFFAQWLNRSGVPQVSGSWRYDAAAKADRDDGPADTGRRAVQICARRGRVGGSNAAPVIRQVQVAGRESTLRIPADAEPAAVVLDPGVWLLADLGSFHKTEH